jgi:hypothetical protein
VPPAERKAYAWERLKVWVPRVKVVQEMVEKYSISPAQAYDDVKLLYRELAAMRGADRKAEAEALLLQIDDEIERLRDDGGGDGGRATVSRALAKLWDMRARLTRAYPDTARVTVMLSEFKALTGLSDELLEAMIAGEERRLLEAGAASAIDAQSTEAPAAAPESAPAAPPLESRPARRRSRKRGRGSATPGA